MIATAVIAATVPRLAAVGRAPEEPVRTVGEPRRKPAGRELLPGRPCGPRSASWSRSVASPVMTIDRRASRRGPSATNADLVGAVHAVLATAAVAGVLLLVRSGPVEANLPTDLVRASGIVALIWAYSGLILGLSIGIRPVVPVRAAPLRSRSGHSIVLALHRQVNVVVLALVLLHALVFAFAQPGGSLLVALVPLVPGPQALGYTLGVLALYLAAILGPSYYLRNRIGRRTS